VELSTGRRLAVDYVVLATGYKPDMRKVPYLSGVVDRLELADGFPVLDEHFQSSLPGLFITGFPATRDFGPFFGFVRGCPAATRVVLLETVVWCVLAIGLVIFDGGSGVALLLRLRRCNRRMGARAECADKRESPYELREHPF
jgi:hypothetical protein